MRAAIWKHYREGQEDDKNPSRAYCEVAKACVIWLAAKEGKPPDTSIYDLYLNDTEVV